MLYHLLLQTVNTQQSAGVSPGQPHLLQYHLDDGKDVKRGVNDLSQAAKGGSLYVIADEVVSDFRPRYFQTFSNKLLSEVPHLHLWAASCFHGHAPAGWPVEYLTRPLRSPPAVVREVEQDINITGHVLPYDDRGVPVVREVDQGTDITKWWTGTVSEVCPTTQTARQSDDCITEVRVTQLTENVTASTTTVTSTNRGTTPPCLQWRDVLVCYWGDVGNNSGMVTGLQEAGITVRVMKDEDIEDVATARSDVVWVARGDRVRGLERKVVVCLSDDDSLRYKLFLIRSAARLHCMSRCTSQLVIVSPDD